MTSYAKPETINRLNEMTAQEKADVLRQYTYVMIRQKPPLDVEQLIIKDYGLGQVIHLGILADYVERGLADYEIELRYKGSFRAEDCCTFWLTQDGKKALK